MRREPPAGDRPATAVALTRSLAAPPADCLAAVGEAAEMWGAAWTARRDGGRLELPVLAGIRRGVLSAAIELRGATGGAGTDLRLTVESARYRLNVAAVMILALGLVGAATATLWPFFPVLLAAAPLAVVLALAAWFLVASKVRSSTADDFLELVEELAGGDRSADPSGVAPR